MPKGGKPWLWFKELNEEYGPVVYLRRAGTLWLGEGEELTPLFNQNGKFREVSLFLLEAWLTARVLIYRERLLPSFSALRRRRGICSRSGQTL